MREKLPEGWVITNLENCVMILDSYRKPVSFEERSKRIEGKPVESLFPYYGATGKIGLIDDYLLEGRYVLIGEDGAPFFDFKNRIAYIVNGKIWVNNHAHVLQGKLGVSTEHLMLSLKETNLSPYVTGAVQPKLNQGNMNQIPFVLGGDECLSAFASYIAPPYEKYRANVKAGLTLSALRDTLLPKLLSGELRVKDAEKFVERVAI